MSRQLHLSIARIVLVLALAVFAGTMSGCKQPPALTKAELEEAKMPEKHPEIDPKIAMDCRKCHREQPAIEQ